MFDYSDCVAFVGLKNKAGELDIPDRIKMVGDTLQIGDYEHQGNREQTGNYTIVGDIIINGKSLWSYMNNHTHPGDSGGTTGVPNI